MLSDKQDELTTLHLLSDRVLPLVSSVHTFKTHFACYYQPIKTDASDVDLQRAE